MWVAAPLLANQALPATEGSTPPPAVRYIRSLMMHGIVDAAPLDAPYTVG